MSAPPPDTGFDGERYARRLAPVGGLLVVFGLCGGGWLAALLVPVGCLLLLLACVSRRDGLLVIGPFARAELVASARRGRPWLWRVLYALAAAGLFVLFVAKGFTAEGQASRALPRYAEYFFYTFAAVQLAYLGYLTSALFAPIAAEEREKKRWEMLLTTDLRNREIFFGKAAGRVPQLLDPLLASLPVLAMLPFVGGVSPVLVGCAAVVTVATVLGVGGVAAFNSVIAPTARKAVEQTNGLMGLYYALSFALCALAIPPLAAVWTFPTSIGLPSPVEVRHVVEAVNAGNPVSTVVMHVSGAVGGTDPLEDRLAGAARRYAAFHLGLSFLFGLTAVARLRATRAWATPAGPPPGKMDARKPRAPVERPPVSDRPVAWAERYTTLTRAQLQTILWFTPRRLAKIAAVIAVVLAGSYVFDAYRPDAWFKAYEMFRVVVPGAVWMLTWGVWLGPAVRGARSIARERSADTLDGLKLTALTPREIVFQKWLGAATAEGSLYGLTVAIAVAGVVTGFVHPAGLLALAILPVYVGSAAAVGVFFSARAKNPTSAVRTMVIVTVLAGWVLGQLVTWKATNGTPIGLFAVYPPAAMAAPLFAWVDSRSRGPHPGEVAGAAVMMVVGLAAYTVLGWAALRAAERRLDRDRQE